jgi:hypothetical protein
MGKRAVEADPAASTSIVVHESAETADGIRLSVKDQKVRGQELERIYLCTASARQLVPLARGDMSACILTCAGILVLAAARCELGLGLRRGVRVCGHVNIARPRLLRRVKTTAR